MYKAYLYENRWVTHHFQASVVTLIPVVNYELWLIKLREKIFSNQGIALKDIFSFAGILDLSLNTDAIISLYFMYLSNIVSGH